MKTDPQYHDRVLLIIVDGNECVQFFFMYV